MRIEIIIIAAGVLFYMATCWAILDISKKNFGSMGYKIMWALISLIPFIGCIIYFLIGSQKGIKHTQTISNK